MACRITKTFSGEKAQRMATAPPARRSGGSHYEYAGVASAEILPMGWPHHTLKSQADRSELHPWPHAWRSTVNPMDPLTFAFIGFVLVVCPVAKHLFIRLVDRRWPPLNPPPPPGS